MVTENGGRSGHAPVSSSQCFTTWEELITGSFSCNKILEKTGSYGLIRKLTRSFTTPQLKNITRTELGTKIPPKLDCNCEECSENEDIDVVHLPLL